MTQMAVNPKSLDNLEPTKWKKGHKPFKSPGRPPTRNLVEMIRADFERNPQAIVNLLKKRKPETYAAYLAGKPAETINVGGIAGQPIEINSVESLTIPELKARLAALKAKGEA